jgi:predicted membrane protein
MVINIQKCLYRYAYSYARKCQKKFFFIYVNKYIKKHIKYRDEKHKSEYEYDVLIILNDSENMYNVIDELKKENNSFTQFLYQKNIDIYTNRKSRYIFRMLSDDQHVQNLTNEYNAITNIKYVEIIDNIVNFSVKFQEVFSKSDLTAKTKIQEHWFMRLPIYTTCVTIIYAVNIIDMNKNDWTRMIFMTIAYFLSLYLVALRFHQSVSAETKKYASELYSKEKNRLYISLMNKTKQ